VVAITKEPQPRSFRHRVRPGYAQPGHAVSRAQKDAAAARREAERLFGALEWQDPEAHGVLQDYVVAVARCQAISAPEGTNE